jgi:hypothetical protein
MDLELLFFLSALCVFSLRPLRENINKKKQSNKRQEPTINRNLIFSMIPLCHSVVKFK